MALEVARDRREVTAKPANHRHRLATTPTLLPEDAHDAVVRELRAFRRALLRPGALVTAVITAVGGVDEPVVRHVRDRRAPGEAWTGPARPGAPAIRAAPRAYVKSGPRTSPREGQDDMKRILLVGVATRRRPRHRRLGCRGCAAEAARHRRPRVHDHPQERCGQAGEDPQEGHLLTHRQRQVELPQLRARRPRRRARHHDVSGTGRKTVTIKLRAGKYKFYCRPHESSMFGFVTVS